MAKRRQTTGLPKTRKKQASSLSPEGGDSDRIKREHQSHAEREAQIQKYLIWGTGAVIVVIAIVIAFAFLQDEVINPKRTVATVNGEKITVSDYQARVRLERLILIEEINLKVDQLMDLGFTGDTYDALNQLYQFDQSFPATWSELTPEGRDQMGLRVLNDMIDDLLVRQEAERLGISVTQEEINEQVQRLFLFDADLTDSNNADPELDTTAEVTEEPATPTPTPFVSPTPSPAPTATATAEATVETEPTVTFTPFPTIEPIPTRSAEERIVEFDQNLEAFYERASEDANLSRDQVNAYFETQALRDALSRIVVEGSTGSTWVNARHILTQTEEEALDIVDALQTGESFADLARINSIDTNSGAQGGELGWQDTDAYVEAFAEAVRTLTIGEISAPVQSDFGFHIIQVRAREERDLDEQVADYNREQDFGEWLATLRTREETEYEINNIWLDNVPTNPLYAPR